MFWFKKHIVKKMLKELEMNINGMKKMANAYKTSGGFLEIANLIRKEKAEDIIPKDLLEEGRKAEEEFADVCDRLADCYQRLME